MPPRSPLPEAPPGLWDLPAMAQALDNRDLGAVLRIYQKWTGASQPQMAAMTGIAQSTISVVMNGKRQVIKLGLFERFADGLGIPRHRLGLSDPDGAASGVASASAGDGGLPPMPAARPTNVNEGIRVLSGLWRADRDNPDQTPAAGIDPHLWSDATLDWLLHSTDRATRTPTAGRRIGAHDLDALASTTAMFAELDNRYGGGHARRALVEFLATDVTDMLAGRYTVEIGKRLFAAVAEATLLGAWMAYDTGLHGVAQRYFVQALHLAQTAGDRMLAGSVLSAMSHQATYLGAFRHAANLARAAATGTTGVATATLTAQFRAMEARALARLGDAAACDEALSAAERTFTQRNPDDDPAWIGYFDEAELSAEFGHCFRDLGRAADARAWAGRSVDASADGSFPRSDFFAAMVLADAHLDHGDPEPACRVALQALELGDQLKSTRCAQYVVEFRQRLTKVSTSRVVRDFSEQAAKHRLWTPAAA